MPLLHSGALLAQPEFCRMLASLDAATLPVLPQLDGTAGQAYRIHRPSQGARHNGFERLAHEPLDNAEMSLVGDAFLSLIVTRLVLQEDPRLRVGNVTAIKGALVANRVLACLAAAYGLHYAHSRGVDTWQNVRVSADLFEAFCGAVCSSRGDSVCQMWLTDLYRPLVKKPVLFDVAPEPPRLVDGKTGRERLDDFRILCGLRSTDVFSLIIHGQTVGRQVKGPNRNAVSQQLAHTAVMLLETDETVRSSVFVRRLLYGRDATLNAPARPNAAPVLRGSLRGQTDDSRSSRGPRLAAHPFRSYAAARRTGGARRERMASR